MGFPIIKFYFTYVYAMKVIRNLDIFFILFKFIWTINVPIFEHRALIPFVRPLGLTSLIPYHNFTKKYDNHAYNHVNNK